MNKETVVNQIKWSVDPWVTTTEEERIIELLVDAEDWDRLSKWLEYIRIKASSTVQECLKLGRVTSEND